MAMNEKKYISLDELKAGHPLRQHPFESNASSVPEGYFDTLPSRVQARVAKKQHGFSVSWSWQRSVASMAGAGLVAALVWITWPARQEALDNESLSGVSNEAILSYLDEEGVTVDDLLDNAVRQPAVSSDSTLFRYLDVRPEDVRQHLDKHELYDPQTMEFGS